ncbi:MAG: HepT-like ribonuclease domain-containing protein [Gemmatimonadaceae bacterium]
MSRTDLEIAKDAMDHLAILRAHLSRGDLDDQTVADAVSLRLAAAIEAIAQGSDALRERLFAGEWHIAWATRNRIAHNYIYIDRNIIAATVTDDLPELEAALAAEINRSNR